MYMNAKTSSPTMISNVMGSGSLSKINLLSKYEPSRAKPYNNRHSKKRFEDMPIY
ncbi:hypothetical protein DI53_1713 [Sphingobacterium deserti]|uniref:Uncharacterized protein n=1 Tax=Sphingobacterium deserti TaxID=1229276 RepID=A0A0B8T7Z3_9SPHI|nr:hypothetical protein DI53_1713 [Sphingobacterium deserti]